jgi:hypothetical protein
MGNLMCVNDINKSALYCWETLCVQRVSTNQHSISGKGCVFQGAPTDQHSTAGKRHVCKGPQQISTLLLGNVMVQRVSTDQHSTGRKRHVCKGSQQISTLLRENVAYVKPLQKISTRLRGNVMCAKGLNTSALYREETCGKLRQREIAIHVTKFHFRICLHDLNYS